jgi:hypothetical protein
MTGSFLFSSMLVILFVLLIFASQSTECAPGKKKGRSTRKRGDKKTSTTPSSSSAPSLTSIQPIELAISRHLAVKHEEDAKTGFLCINCGYWEVRNGPAFIKCDECETTNYCSTDCRSEHRPFHTVGDTS